MPVNIPTRNSSVNEGLNQNVAIVNWLAHLPVYWSLLLNELLRISNEQDAVIVGQFPQS